MKLPAAVLIGSPALNAAFLGMMPFFQENGQRAGFIVTREALNFNGPPPRAKQ